MRATKQQIESIKRTRKNEALSYLDENAIQMQIVTVSQNDPKYAAIKDLWTFETPGSQNQTGLVCGLLSKMFGIRISRRIISVISGIVGKRIGEKAKKLGRRTAQPDFVLSGLWKLNRGGLIKAKEYSCFQMIPKPKFHECVNVGSFHIELKKPDFILRKKNGQIVGQGTKNEHIYEQWIGLKKLRSAGCYAQFAKGKTDFFRKLDHFLNNYELAEK